MFHLSHSALPYEKGIAELITAYAHHNCFDSITLEKHDTPEDLLIVRYDGSTASITCKERAHFYFGFMLLLQKLDTSEEVKPFQIEKHVYFDSFGVLLDCSRNAVLTVPSIKKYIRFLASIGMNVLMLYTEDTYEVEDYPYFGAYRGKYKKAELRECDDYADLFGIEIIPCIQTLAHLRCALRWNAMADLRDTDDILYLEAPHVIEFLEKLIRAASEPFRSKRIHLGMDEAHYLGLGKYLHENGFHDTTELMMTHLKRVQSICDELQLESLLWSDMFFRSKSPTGDYYDLPDNLDLSHIKLPSDKLHLTYWDYYHHDTAFYEKSLRLHQKMDPGCWFAGGGWTWNGLLPNLSKAFDTTRAGLSACKRVNLRNTICTMWQDAGAETPHFAGLPAVLYYAELGFSDPIDMNEYKERLQYLTQIPYEVNMLIDQIDSHPETAEHNANESNPSKYCLYQDPLLGLFDEQIKEFHLGDYYKEMAAKLRPFTADHNLLVNYYYVLADVLTIKAALGNNIYDAYHAHDRKSLETIVKQDIPLCIHNLQTLKDLREELWFMENKAFGFEVIDIRLGGVMTRLTSAQKRIQLYLDSKIVSIEELEEPHLKFTTSAERELPACNFWENIVTAGNAVGI